MFNAETINDFFETPVVLDDREDYLAYSQYLHTYPDHQAIATTLYTPGGGFVLNADGAPWKPLRKDLTTLVQTWSILSYFNLSPTFYTFDLNVGRARLIYGLVMKMDMDLGSFISRQIMQIA